MKNLGKKDTKLISSQIPKFLILLFFVGCSSAPKEGQWYEHKGTRQRIQIVTIGTGSQLAKMFRDNLRDARKRKSVISFFLSYDDADSLKECVSFETHHPGMIWWRDHIVSVETLKRDYSLVD